MFVERLNDSSDELVDQILFWALYTYYPILQLRKLRPREVKLLAQCHKPSDKLYMIPWQHVLRMGAMEKEGLPPAPPLFKFKDLP